MLFRIHFILMWLLGCLVRLAWSANALQHMRCLVLVWLDDARKHQSNQDVIGHCCLLLERCPKESRLHADLLWRRGFAFYRVGDAPSIVRFLEDLTLARTIAEADTIRGGTLGHILGVLAIYHQQTLHDLERAQSLYSEACHLLVGNRSRSSTLISYGTLLCALGDFLLARTVLETAITVTHNMRHRCCAHLELGRVYHGLAKTSDMYRSLRQAKAQDELRVALCIARRHHYHDEEGDIHRQCARLLADQGRRSEARQEALQAERCYRRAGSTAKAEGAAHMWRVELRSQE